MFVSEALPPHLQERYQILVDDLRDLQKDYAQYKVDQIPVFYAVWKYLSDMSIELEYEDVQDFAERARNLSLRKMVPIKTKATFAGTLYCFREDILDEVFEQMTDEDGE